MNLLVLRACFARSARLGRFGPVASTRLWASRSLRTRRSRPKT